MEKMSDAAHGDEIEIYLKDHYAGGIGALELLEHSIETHAGTPLAAFFAELHGDIKADHDQLHNLMTALGVADSDARNAGAWLAEKFSRAKLGFSGGDGSGLRLLQTLESLTLGITGKRLLWRALHADPAVVASPAADGLRASGAARHRAVGPSRNQTARNGARCLS